jgi:signal transduction histidine kinase
MIENNPNILLIEDSPDDRDIFREILEDTTFALQFLHTAQTMVEGLFILHEKHIDVVLLDLSLPDSQGLESFYKIHDQFPHLTVIILTGLDDKEIALEAIRNGAQDYLVKGKYAPQLLEKSIFYAIERNKTNFKLKKQADELSQFAYLSSHDLQEPLRTINSCVVMLQSQITGQLGDVSNQCIAYMLDASERMKNQIRGLLEYSRLGKKPLLEKIDCKKMLEEVIADLEALINETQAEIVLTALPEIKVYALEFKLLFQNLIENAIKFKKPDTVPQINISAHKTHQLWEFSVQDNGIGIHEKFTQKIFGIFQRLHNQKEYGGYGIGLAHCKKIVELHQGELWVESELGKGSTFKFTIPTLKT